MAREIPLTRGYVAIVDDEDFDWLTQWSWHVARAPRGGLYAARSRTIPGPKKMHQLLIEAPKGCVPDHRNGNGLDNRRENLRVATRSQNAMNKRIRAGVSGFRGVTPNKRRWMAKIRVSGRHHYLGNFATAAEAARAYDSAARALHGPFARLNFPEVA